MTYLVPRLFPPPGHAPKMRGGERRCEKAQESKRGPTAVCSRTVALHRYGAIRATTETQVTSRYLVQRPGSPPSPSRGYSSFKAPPEKAKSNLPPSP